MPQGLTDTHPEVEALRIAMLREATVAKRFSLMSSLTHTAIHHAKQAIARANPEMSARERDLLFVDVHYGHDMARRVRAWLEETTS